MSKTLGGSIFFYNPQSQDYCWREAIECLKAFCDEVVVIDAGSIDGTQYMVKEYADEKTKVICLPHSEWSCMKGKEKLSHFTNIAKSMLSTEWHFNLQADEILHEDCFPIVREAIEKDAEGYFCKRINLWGNTQHQLNVPHSRSPVGTQIIRLAKTKYFSVDDAEGIFAPSSIGYMNGIRIYHMGFVRNKYVHTQKIEHMLTKVFGMGMDKKVEEMNGVFNPFSNFSKEDLLPISEPLPKFVQQWAKERDEINQIEI